MDNTVTVSVNARNISFDAEDEMTAEIDDRICEILEDLTEKEYSRPSFKFTTELNLNGGYSDSMRGDLLCALYDELYSVYGDKMDGLDIEWADFDVCFSI